MNRKAVVREFCFAVLFLLLAVLLIGLTSTALRPVRTNYGAVWGPYLGEPEDSLDYLWLGSSYAYCDVNPAVIYDETGLTGYVLAGPEQTLSQTYWYLRQALETQRPSAVVLEASALHFAKYQNYTQVNVGYLPAGLNKLGAVFTASEPELRTGLLFDLYFYHSRWKTATFGELRSLLPWPTSARAIPLWTGFSMPSATDPFSATFKRRRSTVPIWRTWDASLLSVRTGAFRWQWFFTLPTVSFPLRSARPFGRMWPIWMHISAFLTGARRWRQRGWSPLSTFMTPAI